MLKSPMVVVVGAAVVVVVVVVDVEVVAVVVVVVDVDVEVLVLVLVLVVLVPVVVPVVVVGTAVVVVVVPFVSIVVGNVMVVISIFLNGKYMPRIIPRMIKKRKMPIPTVLHVKAGKTWSSSSLSSFLFLLPRRDWFSDAPPLLRVVIPFFFLYIEKCKKF